MDFSVAQIPGRTLQMKGELDLYTKERLAPLLEEAIVAGGPVYLDLTALQFIDSSGIQVLMNAALALEKVGECLCLHLDDGEVRRALELVGLKAIRNIHIINHREAYSLAIAGA